MTREEFDAKYKSIIDEFERRDGHIFTCNAVREVSGDREARAYSKFVTKFIIPGYASLSYTYSTEGFYALSEFYSIRALLLSNFYEEAIRTKEYLKW